MALVGGGVGGAGNTLNPVGTGSGINYIGDHVYGYSGIVTDIRNTETTMMEFTTAGHSYIVAKVQFSYATAATDDYQYRIYLDDQVIQTYVNGSGTNQNGDDVMNIIIPAGSKVKFTAQNITDTSDQLQCVSIVGRVYA
jgi:hypothetical protein